jgi:hypothetical protein
VKGSGPQAHEAHAAIVPAACRDSNDQFALAVTSRSHLDDDLAKGTARKVLERFTRLFERVDMIDDGTNPVIVQERVHAIKRGARRDSDTPQGGLAKDQWHQRFNCVVWPARKPI